eukprot:TRINITY_DN36923_c0_g1_i1.p1 TRINITY_DN36923_c0_g1~~TRINITY_DN36923_c0_g1_i1.p1  ORF type:complete len:668 (+),score=100.20 TRINITY_DN36923_c0_g1_i1:44-2005(+)
MDYDIMNGLSTFFRIYDKSKRGHINQIIEGGGGNTEVVTSELEEMYGSRFFNIRARLIEIKHSFECDESVDQMLLSNPKKEDQVLDDFIQSYGEPLTEYLDFLLFFQLYCPHAISLLPGQLRRYKNRLPDYKVSLEKKFGTSFFSALAELKQLSNLRPKTIRGILQGAVESNFSLKSVVEQHTDHRTVPGKELDHDYTATTEAWDLKLTSLFEVYAPSKLQSIPYLLEKYADRERDLWRLLVMKYGPDPAWVRRIKHFLFINKIDTGGTVAELLLENAGAERSVLQKLFRQQGVSYEGRDKALVEESFREPARSKIHKLCYEFKIPVPAFTSETANLVYINLTAANGVTKYITEPRNTDYEHRVVNMYAYYSPDRLQNVSRLLKKYRGSEEQLIAALTDKYGSEPYNCWTEKKDLYKQRLTALYEKVVREKDFNQTQHIDTLLQKYTGKEEELIGAMLKKFGDQPSESSVINLRRYYLEYEPENYHLMTTELRKHVGREYVLAQRMYEKHGKLSGLVTNRGLRIIDDEKETGDIPTLINPKERTTRWKIEDEGRTVRSGIIRTFFERRLHLSVMQISKSARRNLLRSRFKPWLKLHYIKCGKALPSADGQSAGGTGNHVYQKMTANRYSTMAAMRASKSLEQKKRRSRSHKMG